MPSVGDTLDGYRLDAVIGRGGMGTVYRATDVALEATVAVKVIAGEGSSETREWTFQCQGCGREFDEHRDRCPVCGTELARKNPA